MVNQAKKNKKYLGIDWGEKRIGLSLADSQTKIATPFKVVGSLGDIIKIISDNKIDVIVVGEPRKMRDRKLAMDKRFLKFAELLKNKVSIPIKTVDERLSSLAAEALPGNKKTKAQKDAIAAMIILQSYLDSNTK